VVVTQALALVGTAFVGTMFWVASPEAAAALSATRFGWSPLVVGGLAGLGQTAALLLLFAFGDQLRRRWRWFDRQCERVRASQGHRLARGAVPLAITSGLLGLPPASVTATLAPGLGIRGEQMLPILFLMRVARLTAVAALATRVGGAFFHWGAG
jgi:hypothetical protein